MGYYDTEHTKNVRDWKEVFNFTAQEPTLAAASVDPDNDGVAHWENQWPQHPPELREACREYIKDMEELAMRLMELIAMTLGLPLKRFEEFFRDHTSSGRINWYPPCPSPELALGVATETEFEQSNIGHPGEVHFSRSFHKRLCHRLVDRRLQNCVWVTVLILVPPTPSLFMDNKFLLMLGRTLCSILTAVTPMKYSNDGFPSLGMEAMLTGKRRGGEE